MNTADRTSLLLLLLLLLLSQGLAGGLALLCLFMTYLQYITAGRDGFLAYYSAHAQVRSTSNGIIWLREAAANLCVTSSTSVLGCYLESGSAISSAHTIAEVSWRPPGA
jgi:hypothetical protein